MRSYFKFYYKTDFEFHSLIFGIFEALFNLFFYNSPLFTAKNNKNKFKNISQKCSK